MSDGSIAQGYHPRMKIYGIVCGALVLAAPASPQPPQAGTPCDRLASLSLPHGAITSAETVREPLPLCRVAATLTPVRDSEIRIEVWMPASGWNGKFQAVGNGAFSGAIANGALRTAVQRGYAAASTDTGHSGGSASFALGHPEKVIDFGWRAVHEMTVAAKLIVSAHYGAAPRQSYWVGCSAGGRQGMKEAQRFPEDYDGIVAGAPGLDWTGRAASAVRVAKVLERSEAARLSAADRQVLHRAVLEACDAKDGTKDGLIDDPSTCTFDPATVPLTPLQIETARLIYSSGLLPGSELGWTDLGWTASARATGLDQFRYIVFKDPAWTIQQFTDADSARGVAEDAGTINALDPNLRPFFDRGGKLIQYHGWSDPQISPLASTRYYSAVVDALGGAAAVARSHRLFMFPGMGHCGGGEGPNTFDMLGALEQWVEHGRAPDEIVATHATAGVVDRTRRVCPYPTACR
jgi:Tannase and feruloyl esterase